MRSGVRLEFMEHLPPARRDRISLRVLVALPLVASAAEVSWDGECANNSWACQDNWNMNVLPMSSDNVTLPGNVGFVEVGTETINRITVQDPNTGLRIIGSLTLNGPGSIVRNASFPGSGSRRLWPKTSSSCGAATTARAETSSPNTPAAAAINGIIGDPNDPSGSTQFTTTGFTIANASNENASSGRDRFRHRYSEGCRACHR